MSSCLAPPSGDRSCSAARWRQNWVYEASFSISESDLTLVPGSGTQTFAAALSNVIEMRILHSQSAPDFRGDTVASTLGVDDIEAKGANDADGDGVPDEEDAFPNDPNESVDTDGDGIGNNADTDDISFPRNRLAMCT